MTLGKATVLRLPHPPIRVRRAQKCACAARRVTSLTSRRRNDPHIDACTAAWGVVRCARSSISRRCAVSGFLPRARSSRSRLSCMRSSLTAGRASTCSRWARTHGGLFERYEKTSLCREHHIPTLEEPSHAQVWIAQGQAGGISWILHAQGRGCLDRPSYCEIEAPLDRRWALSAMIGEGRRTYAALGLTRQRGAPPFKADDVKRLHLLRPWLATALRPDSAGRAAEGDEERPGIAGPSVLSGQLIVTAGGDVVHQTQTAEHLLATLVGGGQPGPALPALIKKIVERIVGAPHGSLHEPLRTQVSSPCGVHTVDAKWLIPAGTSPAEVVKDPKGRLIAVSIELHEHPIAHAARILRMSGATPAQVSAGIKLALGKTKPQIAHELSIRESSVADLARKLYQNSRRPQFGRARRPNLASARSRTARQDWCRDGPRRFQAHEILAAGNP